MDCLILTDDSLVQFVFHPKKFLLLTFEHSVYRNACPTGYYVGYILRSNRLGYDWVLDCSLLCGEFIDFPLRLSHTAVTKFRNLSIISSPLGSLSLYFIILNLLTCSLDAGKNAFLLIPSLHQLLAFAVKLFQLRVDLVEFKRYAFPLDGFFLNFELTDLAIQFVNRLRNRIHLKTKF